MSWPDVQKRLRPSDLTRLREGAHVLLTNDSARFVIDEMRRHLVEDILQAASREDEHSSVQALRLLEDFTRKLQYAADAHLKG